MKAEIDLLALDIDDTLMNRKKEVPERNRLALQACERRGIRIALVSGRSFELMRQFVRNVGIHPIYAACNGARIEESVNGPTLAEYGFERAEAEFICRAMEESGLYFNVYTRGKCYMGNPERFDTVDPAYPRPRPGITGDEAYPYETVCSRERMWSEGLDGVYKFVATGMREDPRFPKLEERLADLRLSVCSATKLNREFMPHGVDKGSVVRMLCERMNLSADRVMAFGDQTNDIPMLRSAGWPVAMGNAVEPVKAAARIVAPDCDLGGVGQVLEEYVL